LKAGLDLRFFKNIMSSFLLNQFLLRKTGKIVKEEMEGALNLSIPLVVETKVGKNWGEME